MDGEYSEVGFSCLPILLVIIVGLVMLAVAIGAGFRKFASHIPVAGSCSVALAAAAHRPTHDADAAYLPVQWGAVGREESDGIGHCCFTSEPVHDLVPGRQYAGYGVSKPSDVEANGQPRRRIARVNGS